MSFFDKFKKKHETVKKTGQVVKDEPKKSKAKAKNGQDKTEKKPKVQTKIDIKDKSGQASRVLIKPLQTEKVTDQMVLGQYSFEIAVGANRSEVKKAVKAVYGVNPVRVNIINMRGKAVRFGRTWSQRKNWKKAIVTLKSGDKIEVFEGI